jgi:hypothetical protein
MRWCGIQVEVLFFDVLAMVPLTPCQAEEALFENRVSAIPEGDGETDKLMPIANSADAILAPAIGLRTCMIVWKIVPGGAVRAVVLPDRPLEQFPVGCGTVKE